MGLFGPDWNSLSERKARAAIKELKRWSKYDELAQAAKKARREYIRQEAVGMLSDPDVQIDIAQNDRSSYVRRAAINSINKYDIQANLHIKNAMSGIANNDPDIDVRKAANNRLESWRKEESERKREAEEKERQTKRKKEIQQMTESEALTKIAKSDFDKEMRIEAINNKYLSDQTVFAYIATHDIDESVRSVAIRRITDTTALDSVKSVYCNKDNHFWTFLTRTLSNDEAMELHDDRMYVRECLLCGIEKRFFE